MPSLLIPSVLVPSNAFVLSLANDGASPPHCFVLRRYRFEPDGATRDMAIEALKRADGKVSDAAKLIPTLISEGWKPSANPTDAANFSAD